ncbi:MAG: AAA family ATPase [Streptosporangiales bacterium]|nr:AAA family ATPase [Streptosporangiales bacterium]
MTQNADGSESYTQPPHAPVQADADHSDAGQRDEPPSQSEPADTPDAGSAGWAPQHPSFDEAQDPWGQGQVGYQPGQPWQPPSQDGVPNHVPHPQPPADPYRSDAYPTAPYYQDYPQPGSMTYPQGHEQPQEPQPQGPQPPQPAPTPRPDVVNPFLEQSHSIPQKGMRRAVYRATFGTVNLGPSDDELAARLRRERVTRPLHGAWRVVVMSIKGGVGKTTTAAMTGRTLAEWRGDRVVALDTNPDMGTLGDRLVGATDVTVRGLLAHDARSPIQQVAEVNRYTNLAGRLHVLANEQDPAVSEDFSGIEYQHTLSILERFYNVIIADCGTGVLRPWVRDMLALANTLVVVAEPKGDAATRAAGTLDWIAQHGFHDLVSRSVAVINYRSPTPKSLDVDALTTFFAERCRAVCKIRYDEHLDLGVQIQYDPIPDAPTEAYVADATKEDYLELAATIADEFR